MKILGIESSCDETAVSVVKDGRRILSNVISSQVEEHIKFGGVVPEIASRRHAENISDVTEKALKDAKLTLDDIDAVAVTYAPGLIGALLVGVNFAKGLSFSKNLPLVPVHHLRSHIAANYLTYEDLKPPFFCLVVSGGNTLMTEVRDYTDFKIIGRTRDDAAGEALDKAARTMGLNYPGGLNLDKISKGGNDTAFKFPKPRVEGHPFDFSFSGLKTSVINTIHNRTQKGEEINKADLGASFIKAVVDSLAENTEKAMEKSGMKSLAIAGGVSANSVLRKRFSEMCEKRGWKLYLPDLSLCTDNGAMVASQGYYEFINGNISSMELNAYAGMDIDNLIK